MEKAILEQWNGFLVSTDYMWCWWCGRGVEHFPEVAWAAGFPLLIERAHVVNKPRRKDRRSAVLLCSICHRVQHGGKWPDSCGERLCAPGLPEMIWLKRIFDPEFYDPEFLEANHVGLLPAPLEPPMLVVSEYRFRRGGYPGGALSEKCR